MALDKKVSFFLSKYLAKIKFLYSPDEMWLWGSRAYGSPDEFARKKEQISIVNEAIKKGIRII